MFFGNVSKFITLFTIGIVVIVFTWILYLDGRADKLSCDQKIELAIKKERLNYEKLNDVSEHIGGLDNDGIDEWLQSNGGFRQ